MSDSVIARPCGHPSDQIPDAYQAQLVPPHSATEQRRDAAQEVAVRVLERSRTDRGYACLRCAELDLALAEVSPGQQCGRAARDIRSARHQRSLNGPVIAPMSAFDGHDEDRRDAQDRLGVAAAQDSPEGLALVREAVAIVAARLRAMGERDRSIVLAAAHEEPHRQAAERMGMTVGAFDTRLSRTRAALSATLGRRP